MTRNGHGRARAVLASFCAALTTAAAVVTAGCTSPADRPAPADTGKLRDLTYAEQITVERAEEMLVKRCMEAKGLPYWTGWIPSVADRKAGGYVITDVNWAKKHGYGRELDRRVERERLGDRNTAYARKLSKSDLIRYNTALDGDLSKGQVEVELPQGGTVSTTRDGCLSAATTELYGDLPTWFRAKKTTQSLTALYAPDIVADAGFQRALKAWAHCMREAGHPYDDPREIREQRPRITRGMSRGAAQATEVELAVAEATCANSTPLARTARTLERRLRSERLRPYRDDIATFQRMSLTALARAEALGAGTASP